MSARRWLLASIAAAAIALLLGRAVAQVYTDYLWFASLGATDVWRARLTSLLILRLVCGMAATLFVFANLYAVRQSVVSLVLPRRIGNLDIGEEVPRRQLTWTAAVLSLLIGMAMTLPQRDWSSFLLARIGQPFGESDPYFAADLGFFVHRLPFELSLFKWTLVVVLIVIGFVILLYALTPSLRWERGGLYVSGYVRRHLTTLAGVLLLVLAWHYRLEMFTVLGEGTAGDGAFAYLDHRVGIPGSLVLSLVTLGAGLTVVWAGWSGQVRLAFAALTAVLLAALATRQMAPFIARRAMADRDPVLREQPYEATRAGYTRRAFAVDRIGPADTTVIFATLAEAAPFVSMWDEDALRRTTEVGSTGTTIGWLVSDTGLVALVPATGGVAAYVASATDDVGNPGRPARILSEDDPPPLHVVADSSARAMLVSDSTGRIAAPSLATPLSRVAHALSLQDFRVWFGALPTPNPRLVTKRTVSERVAALAPFFAQGSSISPVWFSDSLLWAVDLYSSSRTYPLSRRVIAAGSERAYFHHAATALVNATTGRTVLVPDSLPDPVASTWMARFPRLFVRASSLPMSVRRQLPPQRDGARTQASAFGRYGARGEEDVVRRLPDNEGADSALAHSPMPLIGFPQRGNTALVLPLLDRTDRVRGLFIALGGPQHRSLWLPLGGSGPLWSETLDRLRTVDTVRASFLVRGHVRVIPVAGQTILVQPRYDWRSAGGPRLLYVAAGSGDSVRTARTLLQLAGRIPIGSPTTSRDFRERVSELYEEMRRATARGDWAAFGRAFDALGALLSRQRGQTLNREE